MRRRVVSVTNETEGGLTTLARIKLELGITGTTNDELLRLKIREATSDIELRIRPIRHATVVEQFWPETSRGYVYSAYLPTCAPFLSLTRYPIESVTSIIVDGETLAAGDIRIDNESGQIHRLDSSAGAIEWEIGSLVTATYVGGYLFPEDTAESLPPVLESAAVEMLTMFWMARGRDPLLRAEENPGVSRFEYWVGAIGPAGDLPPSIQGKLTGFLRASVFA